MPHDEKAEGTCEQHAHPAPARSKPDSDPDPTPTEAAGPRPHSGFYLYDLIVGWQNAN